MADQIIEQTTIELAPAVATGVTRPHPAFPDNQVPKDQLTVTAIREQDDSGALVSEVVVTIASAVLRATPDAESVHAGLSAGQARQVATALNEAADLLD